MIVRRKDKGRDSASRVKEPSRQTAMVQISNSVLKAFDMSNLGDANIFEVRLFKRQELFAGYFVFEEGMTVHGEADGL